MKTNFIHKCTCKVPHAIYGPAVNLCREDHNGTYWVGNGEYASQVNYCPFCGKKAPTQIKDEDFEIQENL